MKNLQDIVNDILEPEIDDHEETRELADVATEIIVVDIDEIHAIFGAPMVYADLVGKRGVGSISYIYTTLVHPVISGIFNSCISDDEKEMKEFLHRLTNLRGDDELGNLVYDRFEQRIWELVQTSNNLVNVRTKELMRLCISIAEIVLVSIRDYALDYSRRELLDQGMSRAAIQIDERCSAHTVPNENPDSLVITLTYGWVYL